VVREGGIFHLVSGCWKFEVTANKHVKYFNSGLFWSVLGYFIGIVKEKVGKK
jgi:di/tricarboxylate transporter